MFDARHSSSLTRHWFRLEQLKVLTVRRGRVSFFLLRADEHGEGRVRHMEALIWKEKRGAKERKHFLGFAKNEAGFVR